MALAGIIMVVVLFGWFTVESQIELKRRKNKLTQTNIAPPHPWPPRPQKSATEYEEIFNKLKETIAKHNIESSAKEYDEKVMVGIDVGNSKDFTIISDYKNGVLVNERLIRNEEEINEPR